MARSRKASSAHGEVFTDPCVQLRRELTVKVLEEPCHHFLTCPAGLSGIAHGEDARECRWRVQSKTAEGQCAGDMRRKQGAGFTPSSNRGGDRFPFLHLDSYSGQDLSPRTRNEERTPTRDVEGSDYRTRDEEVALGSHRRGTRDELIRGTSDPPTPQASSSTWDMGRGRSRYLNEERGSFPRITSDVGRGKNKGRGTPTADR